MHEHGVPDRAQPLRAVAEDEARRKDGEQLDGGLPEVEQRGDAHLKQVGCATPKPILETEQQEPAEAVLEADVVQQLAQDVCDE